MVAREPRANGEENRENNGGGARRGLLLLRREKFFFPLLLNSALNYELQDKNVRRDSRLSGVFSFTTVIGRNRFSFARVSQTK